MIQGDQQVGLLTREQWTYQQFWHSMEWYSTSPTITIHIEQIFMYNYLVTKCLISNYIKQSIWSINFFIKWSDSRLEWRQCIAFATSVFGKCASNPWWILILLDLREQIFEGFLHAVFLQWYHSSQKPIEIQCMLVHWIWLASDQTRFLLTIQVSIEAGNWMLIAPNRSWLAR